MAGTSEDGLSSGGRWARQHLPWGGSFEILVPPSGDLIGDHVLHSGGYFPPTFELSLELVEPGARVLDLGAHLGTFSLAAAARGCRVLSVEASPRNAAFLRASARANRFDDLVVVQAAVARQSGTVRFRHEGAWGQITEDWSPDVTEVPARTVAEILAEQRVEGVDLVKLDVEGSEIAAVEGMRGLLSGPDAPPVVFESNAHTLRHFGATPEDLLRAFDDLGYRSYLVGDWELRPASSDGFQPDTCVDYLAVKDGFQPPSGWPVHEPRDVHELAQVSAREACSNVVDARAQVARSLARAPAELRDRRDTRLTLAALTLDPDEAVARAAAWSAAERPRPERSAIATSRALKDLAEHGRALRDRIENIRIRWGARP